MSNIPISLYEQEKMSNKSFHQRNDSGELDVFEAARYFSGANELVLGGNLSQHTSTRVLRQQSSGSGSGSGGGRRMSLDLPTMRKSIPSKISHAITMTTDQKPIIKDKKFKQPSSPGGKLASFLNSLFNQTSSKKKKSKSLTTQSFKDEDESPGGRRKRRSSISHFTIRNGNINGDSKSMYSTSSTTTNSGFRTPPPYGYNHNHPAATKTCEDLLIPKYSDHKPVTGLNEKFKFRDGYLEKHKNVGVEKGRIKCQIDQEKENFKRLNEEDDGGDSDSSSDLFELSNFDLGYCSSGLPVYETTRMDSINRGARAPISSGGPINLISF